MSTEINYTNNKTSWVKQAYFYIVMIGCIFAFSISSIILLQKILTRYAFPKANFDTYSMYGPGYSVESQCQSELSSQFYPQKPLNPTEPIPAPPAPAQDKIDKCVNDKKQQELDRKESEYQNVVLNSMLTLLTTAIIFFVHIKYVKPKN
jgi:hypothetical protein